MPRTVDYPRSSFKGALEVANAVHKHKGCSFEVCAAEMGMKDGGGFRDKCSAAVKFGLVVYESSKIITTDLANNIRLAYNDEERIKYMREACLSPDLFKDLYERYKGMKVPTDILPKVLEKECDVNNQVAQRVAKYFIQAMSDCELLTDGGEIVDLTILDNSNNLTLPTSTIKEEIEAPSNDVIFRTSLNPSQVQPNQENFFVTITGPSNFTFASEMKTIKDFDSVVLMLEAFVKSTLK